MGLLQPDLVLKSVLDIEVEVLRQKGITGLLVDIDNTLVAWEDSFMDDDFLDWVNQMKRAGLSMCIVSNALQERTRAFAELLGIPGVGRAMKPLNKAFLRGLDLLGLPSEQVAVVGDQLFTDVLGGNRLGMYTILINPLSRREFFLTKVVRKVETKVLERMVRQGRLGPEAIATRLGGRK